MNWYKFHIGDYLTRTHYLSEAEDLTYRRLLDLYYMSEAPISLDTHTVSKKIRMEVDLVETILNEFFDKKKDGYHNARCDEELKNYQRKVEFNREVGKRGGRPKKDVTQTLTEVVSENNPNQEPRTKNKTPSSRCDGVRFEEFWNVWPSSKRKIGKGGCIKKWNKRNLDEIADRIIAHVKKMKLSDQWLSGYDPAPLTYLNQDRWLDDNESTGMSLRRVL